jgi:hypothetical protein
MAFPLMSAAGSERHVDPPKQAADHPKRRNGELPLADPSGDEKRANRMIGGPCPSAQTS